METMMIIWLGVFVVALAIEFATADMVSIWFAISAIPSFIISLIVGNELIWLQVLLFVALTVVLFFFTRPVVMKYFKVNEIKTNVDSIIGQEGFVTERITETGKGRVRLRLNDWAAVAHETIEVDEKVRVLDVEGATLIVEKI